MTIPGCDAYVALDRKYSSNHIWVLPSQDNRTALIGITVSLVKIGGGFTSITVRSLGTVLNAAREDSFGWFSGYKVITDLISPVSGIIIDVYEKGFHADGHFDAYDQGLAVIQLSNPGELDKLYTPQYYAYLESLSWSGPIPPMY